jgi:ornithine cyclodeaminase/alanine dehydrogenase-like protein (mu-crystallin family)
MRVLALDAAAIHTACPMPDAIDAVAAGFAALSERCADVPLRSVSPLAGAGAQMLVMSASSPRFPMASVKVVSVAPRNLDLGLATIQAVIVLIDSRTGAPRALLDGASLTALRTGAAGGLAARRLAPTTCDIVALYGAGAQARTQLEGLLAERRPREVRIVARTRAHVDSFIGSFMPPAGVRLVVGDRTAANGAQVVICATTSAEPVFATSDLAADAHLTGVGSYRPEACEFAPEILRGARVVVDHRSAAMAESGEVITAVRLGFIAESDLIEIGEAAAHRMNGDQRTVFKSVGNAIQDLAVGCRVVERAETMGLGRWIEL